MTTCVRDNELLIESLCWFSDSVGPRHRSATAGIRDILSRQRAVIRRICVAALVMQLAPLLVPIMIRALLPEILKAEEWTGVSGTHSGSVVALMAGIVLIGLVRATACYSFISLSGKCGHQFVAAFRELAYAQLMRLPARYVERREVGRILLRFIGDTDSVRSWLSRTGPRLLADLVAASMIYVAMLVMHAKLTVLVTIPLLPIPLLAMVAAARIRNRTRQARTVQSKLTGYVESRLRQIRVTKQADSFAGGRRPFREMLHEVAHLNALRDRDAARFEAVGQVVLFGVFPVCLLIAINQGGQVGLSVTNRVTFVWLVLHLTAILRTAMPALAIHQKALVSIQRLHVLLSRKAEKGRGHGKRRPRWKSLELTLARASGDNSSGTGASLQSESNRIWPRPGSRLHWSGPGVYDLPDGLDAQQLYAILIGADRCNEVQVHLCGKRLQDLQVQAIRRHVFCLCDQVYLREATLEENLRVFQRREANFDRDAGQETTFGSCFSYEQRLLLAAGLPPQSLGQQLKPWRLNAAQRRTIAVCQILRATPRILVIPPGTREGWPRQAIEFLIQALQDKVMILVSRDNADSPSSPPRETPGRQGNGSTQESSPEAKGAARACEWDHLGLPGGAPRG